jgi:hypothetical protein
MHFFMEVLLGAAVCFKSWKRIDSVSSYTWFKENVNSGDFHSSVVAKFCFVDPGVAARPIGPAHPNRRQDATSGRRRRTVWQALAVEFFLGSVYVVTNGEKSTQLDALLFFYTENIKNLFLSWRCIRWRVFWG